MTGEQVKLSDVQRLDLPRANQAQAWLCRLNQSADCVEEFYSFLSPEELERAARFIVEHARTRYIVSRGVLRSLLGGYLAKPAAKMELVIDPLGKPRVDATPLHFNLAHSGDWLIVGFAIDNEVGIDIECHRPVRNWRSIAERHYSSSERAATHSDNDEQPPAEFFLVWTRKEAILKWHGTGLQTPLSSFEVPTSETCGAMVRLPNVQERCWVKSLDAPAGYSAALATSQPCKEIVLREILLS